MPPISSITTRTEMIAILQEQKMIKALQEQKVIAVLQMVPTNLRITMPIPM